MEVFVLVALGLGVILIEHYCPKNPRSTWLGQYRREDLLILAFILIFSVFLGELQKRIGEAINSAPSDSSWPSSAVSFFVVFILGDFVLYWMHRWLHTPLLWKFHRWHHAITDLNGVSGFRSSLLEMIFYFVPVTVIYVIYPPSAPYAVVYFLYSQVFIHLNVQHPNRHYLLVTPAFHRLHHAQDPQFYNKNFGNFWTIWDRIFRTEFVPNFESEKCPIGISEKPSWRWIIGI